MIRWRYIILLWLWLGTEHDPIFSGHKTLLKLPFYLNTAIGVQGNQCCLLLLLAFSDLQRRHLYLYLYRYFYCHYISWVSQTLDHKTLPCIGTSSFFLLLTIFWNWDVNTCPLLSTPLKKDIHVFIKNAKQQNPTVLIFLRFLSLGLFLVPITLLIRKQMAHTNGVIKKSLM